VPSRQSTGKLFALRRQVDRDPTTIVGIPLAGHQTLLAGAVEELDHAVMLELQAFGERPNRRSVLRGQSEQSDHKLILLRLKAARPALLFAEAKEAPDLIPKF